MAIPNISSTTYQTPRYLELTKSSGKNYGYVDEKPYHQASAEGMNFTQLTNAMERIAANKHVPSDNFFIQRTTKASTQDPRGDLWAGFDTSQYDVNNPNSNICFPYELMVLL